MELEKVKKLVLKTLQGNKNAFEPIVEAYWGKVNAIIFRYVKNSELASDLSQEVFILAFSKLNQFNLDAKFAPWLYKIAVNKSIEFLRKVKKTTQVCYEIESIPDNTNITDLVNRFSTFDECVDYLPEAYQVMFILRYGLELSYNDISFVTDVSLGTIKGTFFRIKNILRQKFFSSTTDTSVMLQKGESVE